ncbi:MAG: cytidine deaminase [Spirochaetales bacterium]|nr:MAG: cytidine deaminase [Spirochaetales bacterium]
MDEKALLKAAEEAALNSYSPYSRFRVGAAILLEDGSIITGTNVENRSFGLTNCAERSALFTAISSGRKDFAALAVACPDAREPVSPCGACRQALSEFTSGDFPVYYKGSADKVVRTTMGELLPADSLHDLKTREP